MEEEYEYNYWKDGWFLLWCKEAGENDVMSLVRCAWAGSQKYGVLTWSGDIHSSFRAMREQLQAGLNMGLAGIPWWTSDIGGFLGGDIKDKQLCSQKYCTENQAKMRI